MKVMSVIIIIAVSIAFYVWMNIECLKTGYEINKLKTRMAEVSNENKVLAMEVSKLKSLERVESIARNDLSLITPEKFEYIAAGEPKAEKTGFAEGIKGFFVKALSLLLKLF